MARARDRESLVSVRLNFYEIRRLLDALEEGPQRIDDREIYIKLSDAIERWKGKKL